MTGLRVVVASALMIFALISTGAAQTPLLVPGVRIRVTGPCPVDRPSSPTQCAIAVGRLRSWTPDSVIVDQGSGPDRAVARRAASLIEVSDGIRSHTTLGALVGGGVGTGVGLAVALARPCDAGSNNFDERVFGLFVCGGTGFFTVLASMAAGATAGWIVGLMTKSERWASLPSDIVTVTIAPRGNDGLGLTIRVRF